MRAKKSIVLVLGFIIILFLVFGYFQLKPESGLNKNETTNVQNQSKPIDRLVFEAKVVAISSGPPHIVSSKTVLDFGKLPINTVERKEVLITNNRNFPVIAIPSANGSISKWISFDKDKIFIEARGKNTSLVSIRVSKPGNYSGYVIYTFFKS